MSVNPKKTEDETKSKQQVSFLKESVNYNIGIIQYLDQKTHLLLGTISILIPLTIGLFNGIDFSTNSDEVVLGVIGYSLTMLVLFISLILSINVIIARIPSVPKTIFFGLDIVEESRTSFKQKITSLTLDQQISNLSDQAYTLGSILKTKFHSYNWALTSLFISVELLISSFIAVKSGLFAVFFFILLMIIDGGLLLFLYYREKD